MIAMLKGQVKHSTSQGVILLCNHVGYSIDMLTHQIGMLEANQEMTLWIHHHIRQDVQSLFGFLHLEELELFRQLIKTNGLGPKMAMQMLCTFSASQLAEHIIQKSTTMLQSVKGVGKKVAEKLVIELQQDPLVIALAQKQNSTQKPTASDDYAQAHAALVALGYKAQHASKMLEAIDASNAMSIQDLIKAALAHA